MSDFEQWFGGSKYTQVVYPSSATKQIALDGWQAAIASMPGEAVAKIVYDRKTNENGNTYHKSRPQVWPLISNDELLAYPHSTQLFTYPPSAASKIAEQESRIKELEEQLEVARKDAERYQCIKRAILRQPGGQYSFATYMGWIGSTFERGFDEAIDAAIHQIGGGE